MRSIHYYLLIFRALLFTQIIISCSSSKKAALPCSSFSKFNELNISSSNRRKANKILHVQYQKNKKTNTQIQLAQNSKINKQQISSDIGNNSESIFQSVNKITHNTKPVFLNNVDLLIASTNNFFLPIASKSQPELFEKTSYNKYSETRHFISSPDEIKCDIIILNNGDEIEAKVIEITQNEVKYKKCDYLEGPTFVKNKSDVFMIKYGNGTKDVFTVKDSNSQTINKPNRKVSGAALISFMFAIVGWFVPWPIGIALCLFAFIFGIAGIGKVNRHPNKYMGKGFGIVGLILGIIGIIVIIALFASA